MAANDQSPGFIKLHYQSTLSEHIATLPVNPFFSVVSGIWFLLTKAGGAGLGWTSALDAYITVLRPLIHSTVSVTYAELWTKDVGVDPVYRDTYNIGLAGTNSTGTLAASEIVLTYRTENGGNGRVYVMDGSFAVNLKLLPPSFNAITAIQNLSAFVLGSNSIFYARDNSYPISTVKVVTKTNDKLRRKYNLA